MLTVLKRRSTGLTAALRSTTAATGLATGAAASAWMFLLLPDLLFLAAGLADLLLALALADLLLCVAEGFLDLAAPAGASAKVVNKTASAIFVFIIVIDLV